MTSVSVTASARVAFSKRVSGTAESGREYVCECDGYVANAANF